MTGTVTNSAGTGIEGLNVIVKGSGKGTTTKADGTFTITAASNSTLVISGVGFASQEFALNGNTSPKITLQEASGQLENVVVTALGITKEARRVGYAVSTVGGESLNKAREVNVANSLTGRVAGLKVTGTSSGPGGTSKILLRGVPSMNGAGSPLFVINGVPMDNTQRGASGEWGGADNGDGIGNINPDDIETMTVLKGQAASALYGTRASNGVIMITTKTGKRNSFSVEYNLNYMADKAIDFTDFQYVYGQGQQGHKPGTALEARNSNRMSWGERLDGSQVIGFDGNMYPYSAVKNNITSFYRTGSSLTNSVAMSGGNDRGSFRLSVAKLDNNSIIRNSGLDRITMNFNGEQKITDKLTARVMVNYVDEKSKLRPQLSDGPLNPNNFTFLASNVSQKIFNPGFDQATGYETQFSDDEYVTNPWFVVNKYINDLSRKRWITATSLKYDFNKWLYAQARVGYDIMNDRDFRVEPWGTAYTADRRGNLQSIGQQQRSELNIDGLIGANPKITDDLGLNIVVGANTLRRENERVANGGSYFLVRDVYTLANVRDVRVNAGDNYSYWKMRTNSAYYSADIEYKQLTLSTSGRLDAYSTLTHAFGSIKDENTIFTPSVSTNYLFGELINSTALNFGKLRASYAQTSGEPGQAYQTDLYYSLGSALGGIPMGAFSSDLPNLFLKPFVTSELEIGTELRFLNSRLNLDVAWYTKKTKNEIMKASYSPSTGATSGVIGSGSMKNTGLEVQVTAIPVRTANFTWTSTLNFTKVKNKVLKTDENDGRVQLGVNRGTLGNAFTAYAVGYSSPQIFAYDYAKTDKGEMIVDGSGLPVRGELIPMGSVMPTTFGGWNNELNYKSFNFSVLIDYNFGNKILSATKYYAIRRGMDAMTLDGRDGVTKGVTSTGAANTVTASAQDYYTALANNVTSVTVLDGDFIKLRQITLGYSLPSRAVNATRVFSGINISLVARNLAVLMKKSDHIDPEASFGSNINYYGVEGTSLPSTRSYGVNVAFKFKK